MSLPPGVGDRGSQVIWGRLENEEKDSHYWTSLSLILPEHRGRFIQNA